MSRRLAGGARARLPGPTPASFSYAERAIDNDTSVGELGFRVAWDWGAPASFACVARGDVALFLCEDGQGSPGTWIFMDVDDVDLLHAEYRANGAKIVQPPTNFSWGRREMNVEDLDGHRLRLAGPPTGPSDGVLLAE